MCFCRFKNHICSNKVQLIDSFPSHTWCPSSGSPVLVETITDKGTGPGTGLLLLRGFPNSLVMRPYTPLVCVMFVIQQWVHGPCSVLSHTTIRNTLQVTSQFLETLSLDKTMNTHDFYDPRSDGHTLPQSRYSQGLSTDSDRTILVSADRISSYCSHPGGSSFATPDVYYTIPPDVYLWRSTTKMTHSRDRQPSLDCQSVSYLSSDSHTQSCGCQVHWSFTIFFNEVNSEDEDLSVD